MLADWYMCCCIGLSPDQTSAFLAILDTFESPTDDEQVVVYAIQELQKTDVWLQAYGFHKVLRTLRRQDRSTNFVPSIQEYYNCLTEFVPDEIRTSFQTLFPKIINAAIAQETTTSLIDQVALCAKQCENLPNRISTPIPYLDLREFLPETILLSILWEKLTSDKKSGGVLSARLELDEDFRSLVYILEKAQRGQLGRLAFQLSIHISFKLFSTAYNKEELYQVFSEFFPRTVYEPDLLRTFAEILFIDEHINETSTEMKREHIAHAVDEIISLVELRKLLINVDRSENNYEPLERIGLTAISKRLVLSLPIVYWQATLWELIADYDPYLAGKALAKYWQTPGNLPSEIRVSAPPRSNDGSNWLFQLNSLLILRGLNYKTTIKTEKNSKQEIQEDASWVFFSPWFRVSPL